jgi:hydroxymethylpyrimidine pyrophosphatase-like HAD family hydrolase
VATLSRLLNVPPEQIVTLGDMPNDVLMFRKSGFSIAMGNSSEKVKAQASAVTDSNEDEGFANAVRRFVLLPGRHMTGARGGNSTGLGADGGAWWRKNG